MSPVRPLLPYHLLLICSTLPSVFAGAATLEVPGQHKSIQGAIDGAQPGDVVNVAPGQYAENLTFKSGIRLVGAGIDKTNVTGAAAGKPVLSVMRCAEGNVEGIAFAMEGRVPDMKLDGGAEPVCLVVDSSVEFKQCAFSGGAGLGITLLQGGSPRITGCRARDNLNGGIGVFGGTTLTMTDFEATDNGGAGVGVHHTKATIRDGRSLRNARQGVVISGEEAEAEVSGCVISDNKQSGVEILDKATGRVSNCTFERNGRSGIRVDDKAGRAELRNNTLRDNYRHGIRFAEDVPTVDEGNDYLHNEEVFRGEIWNLFQQERFDDLETIAERLRRENRRFGNGEWQIRQFYHFFTRDTHRMTKQQEVAHLARLERWRKARPKSITPRVAAAAAHIQFAWRERGEGVATTVTPDRLRGMQHYMGEATKLLIEAEGLPGGDREMPLYTLLADAAFFGGNEKATSRNPVRKGLAINPAYYDLHDLMAYALLPRWHGSPAEVVRYAEQAADRTQSDEGDFLYARVALKALSYEREKDFLALYRFDWQRIKKGMHDHLKKYPTDDGWMNWYCLTAVLYGDRAEAASCFERIGNDWSKEVWRTRGRFEAWRKWAKGEGPAPEKYSPAQQRPSLKRVPRSRDTA